MNQCNGKTIQCSLNPIWKVKKIIASIGSMKKNVCQNNKATKNHLTLNTNKRLPQYSSTHFSRREPLKGDQNVKSSRLQQNLASQNNNKSGVTSLDCTTKERKERKASKDECKAEYVKSIRLRNSNKTTDLTSFSDVDVKVNIYDHEIFDEVHFSFDLGSQAIAPPSKNFIRLADTLHPRPKSARDIIQEFHHAKRSSKQDTLTSHVTSLDKGCGDSANGDDRDEDNGDDEENDNGSEESQCIASSDISESEQRNDEAETAFFNRIKARVLRMRKELPPSDPAKLCFATRAGSSTHQEIKDQIEKGGKVKVTSLRYDPVYMDYYGEGGYKSMWIFEISPDSDHNFFLNHKLQIKGRSLPVRRLDDVHMEEFRTHQLYHAIRLEQRQKRLTNRNRKNDERKRK